MAILRLYLQSLRERNDGDLGFALGQGDSALGTVPQATFATHLDGPALKDREFEIDSSSAQGCSMALKAPDLGP